MTSVVIRWNDGCDDAYDSVERAEQAIAQELTRTSSVPRRVTVDGQKFYIECTVKLVSATEFDL